MKKIFLLISLIMLAAGAGAAPYNAEVRNARVAKNGNRLDVSFEIETAKFPSNSRIHITPTVYNGEGRWTTLEPVILVGKKRNVYDRRTDNTEGDRRLIDRKVKTVEYRKSIPFEEEWMQYISVAVELLVEDCCTQLEIPVTQVAPPKLLYYNITPHFQPKALRYELTELEQYDIENPFLHPMEDYAKRYDILHTDRDKGSVALIFKVASAVIDTSLEENSQVLEAIMKAFELIERDPNAILKHVFVAGYASPEGSLALNTRLAGQRAVAVKKYLQERMEEPMEHLFEVYNGREDWDGLRDMVEKSDMEDKEQILEIINAYTMEQEQRKGALKNFKGGVPYRYMLDNFYPKLRTGGYLQVYYEIDRKASVATAVTDEFGRTTWVDPDSPSNRAVTAINKGLESMIDHDFDKALDQMLEFRDDPRAWNNIGVCYMMKGDYEEADKYFFLAAGQGNEDAKKNLDETSWARKVNR